MSKLGFNKTFKIGIFVALGIIFLCVSILELGGKNFLTKSSLFYIEFDQAQGLAEGSVVSMAGLPIGNISEIRIADKRNVVVATVSIETKYMARITNESEIDVRTQGALGDKYIYITPALTGEPIVEGVTLVSAQKPDLLDMLSSQTSSVGTSAVDLLKELKELLREMNSNQRMGRLMENLASTTKNLNEITADKQLRDSFVSLNNILKKVDRGEGTLGALINDSALHDKLMGFMGAAPRNQYLKPLIRESIKGSEQSSR
jgi:phospholipid/cholesterol/gamma-HCH transport system substrate-binding protein